VLLGAAGCLWLAAAIDGRPGDGVLEGACVLVPIGGLQLLFRWQVDHAALRTVFAALHTLLALNLCVLPLFLAVGDSLGMSMTECAPGVQPVVKEIGKSCNPANVVTADRLQLPLHLGALLLLGAAVVLCWVVVAQAPPGHGRRQSPRLA
jgi:hypothetical protein